MMKRKEPVWLLVVRIALAAVFLYSGFIKAIDPVGFGIKIDEYFISFGLGFLHPLSIFCAVAAITMEFLLGFMLLFRIQVKLASWGYLLFMSFFFLLTLWLAVAEYLEIHHGYSFGVVKDCGCFGAAIKMTNAQTFLKNVILMIPTLIIFAKRKRIPNIRLTALGQWCFAALGIVGILFLQAYCYRHLPLIDYSDWKIGTDLTGQYIEKPEKKEMVFIYRNLKDSGIVKLTVEEMDTITDRIPAFYEEYEYVDRIDSLLSPREAPAIDGLVLLDPDGKDHAPELIDPTKSGPVYLLMIPNLEETDERAWEQAALENLIRHALANGIEFAGLTNASQEEAREFAIQHNLEFPIYTNPIDPVKGPFILRDAIRSNPGLIRVEQGVVKGKWNWRDIPEKIE